MTARPLEARPATPLAVSLPRLDTLVSPYTGVVSRLHTILSGPDDARLIRIAASVADSGHLAGAEPPDGTPGGWGESAALARAAAIGEAAERYAGGFVPDAGLALARASELGDAAVAPRRFALFAPRQYAEPGFPFVPFEAETRVVWVEGFALPGGEPALLPAELVYLTWSRLAEGAASIGHATSNGLACGPTLEEAALAGLLELVERDAFVLTWTGRLSLPLLDWSDDGDLVAYERRYLLPSGARHAAVDLSGFLEVPAVLAVVEGDGRAEPALAVGAGCAPTVGQAVRKALAEAYAVRSWGRSLMARAPRRTFAPDYADVTTFGDHIDLYTHAEQAQAAAFLTASAERRSVADVPSLPGTTPLELIESVARRLAAAGSSAYAVDVTTVDVAAAGLAVAKVVAPELCALDVRHRVRFLGGDRLYRAAHDLGLRSTPLTWEDVNPDPHPFP